MKFWIFNFFYRVARHLCDT